MKASSTLLQRLALSARSRARSLSTSSRDALELVLRGSAVIHEGRRARTAKILEGGRIRIKKSFAATKDGLESLQRELLAQELFRDRPWFAAITHAGPDWVVRPFYPARTRLDRAATRLNERQRLDVALQALSILGDIHLEGYAHCDFHSKNLYWRRGKLVATDFEVMQAYPGESRPPLPESYDITGKGLASPFRTDNMCYVRAHPASLSQVLRVPLDRLLDEYTARLKRELRHACLSFETCEGRHRCRASRIYGSFSLPYLTVSPGEAQRDSNRRLERFGMSRAGLAGKRVLDLGCNVGAMLLEMQRYNPGQSVGIEHDLQKVQIARRISAYNGINNVEFLQADIDHLRAGDLDGPFEVVLCLAMEAHVKDPGRMYSLLGETTSEVLYFEGNARTDPVRVRAGLLEAGFADVQFIGLSDDDCLPDNNNRPMFIAWK